jgi:hypothetical protein
VTSLFQSAGFQTFHHFSCVVLAKLSKLSQLQFSVDGFVLTGTIACISSSVCGPAGIAAKPIPGFACSESWETERLFGSGTRVATHEPQ